MYKIHPFIAAFVLLFFACALPLTPLAAQNIKPVATEVLSRISNGVEFESVSIFSPALKQHLPSLQVVRDPQFLNLDEEACANVHLRKPQNIQLQLPYKGEVLEIDLYLSPILANDFSVITSGNNNLPTPYEPGAYYRGIVHNRPSSIATFSVFKNEVMAMISDETHGNLVLGRLDLKENTRSYILYAENDLIPANPFECGAERLEPVKGIEGNPTLNQPDISGCVQIYFECEYSLYQNKGTVANTVSYVTGLFNEVATLYANDGITVTMSQIYVWTTPDDYPTGSSSDVLTAFRTTRTSFSGNLAHLLGITGNGLGGIAYVDVLCASSFAYGFSDIHDSYGSVPTYSWSVEVVTHELGHNHGSPHTHSCTWPGGAIDTCYTPEGNCPKGPAPTNGGTIMSYCHLTQYGINFNNGFGPLPKALIQSKVTSAIGSNCIVSNCPTYSCNAPGSISFSNLDSTSVTVNWPSVLGASSYTLQYRVYNTSTWTSVSSNTNSKNLTGLSSSTRYEAQVRTVCGGSNSPYYAGAIFKTLDGPCPVPINFVNTSTSPTSSTINWTQNGSPASWTLEYGPRGFTQGNGTSVTLFSKPYTITGLEPCTSYDYYLRSDCGGALGNSPWAGPNVASTQLTCDSPSNAVTLTVDADCPGQNCYQNISATTANGEYSPLYPNNGFWNTGISNTVWFKFVAPASGAVLVTTDISPLGSLDDTQIALYKVGSVSDFSTYRLLVSNEDGGTLGAGYATYGYYVGLTPGQTYYVQVDGWNTDKGYFCIEVHETMAIPNLNTSCTAYTATVNGTSSSDIYFNIYTKPNSVDIGLPLAAVKTSQNLGTVTVQATRSNSVPSYNGQYYMQRYFNFSATQNNSGSKDVILLYTQAELNNYLSASGNSGTAADLNISHYDGTNEDCSPANNSSGTFSLITNVNDKDLGSSGLFSLQFTSPGFSEMAALMGASPLPLELIDFKVVADQTANNILWRTASESNLKDFILERSANGIDDWEPVQQLSANNKKEINNYQAVDLHPLKVSFYRLRIQSLDGSDEYSHIVVLDRRKDQAGFLSLYPNPAKENLRVAWQASDEYPLQFNIYFPEGRLGKSVAVSTLKGINDFVIDLDGLPAGFYLLEAQTETETSMRTFIKN